MNASGPFLATPLLSQRSFDASVPNPTARLLADTLSRRSYLLIAKPYDASLGVIVPRFYSNDGYASGASDILPDGTPLAHQLFRARLADGAVFNVESRVMSQGRIIDSPIPTYGVVKVILADDDPEVIYDLSLLWRQAELVEYLGLPSWKLSQFVAFARGRAVEITSDTMSYSISWASSVQKYIDLEFQRQKYLGLGGCVRGNGIDGKVSGTLNCPAELTIEASVKPLSASVTRRRIIGWRNGTSAGERFLSITSTGFPEFTVRDDAGTRFAAAGTQALPAGLYTRLAGVLSAGVISLYVENVLVASVSAPGSTFVTLLPTIYWLVNDASGEWNDSEISRVLIWNYARTRLQLQDSASREIDPSSAGLVAFYKCRDQAPGNVTVFDSTSGAHNLTLAGGAIFTGSKTGDVSLAGKYIPRTLGRYLKVEPVAIDSLNGIFQIDSGSVQSMDMLEHRGLQPYTYDGDVSDLTVATFPAGGHWKSCLAKGMFQLNGAVTGRLVVSGKGNNVGGYVEDCAGLVKKLALEGDGAIGDLELISFSYVTSRYPYPVSFTLRLDPVSMYTAMTEIMSNISGKAIGTRDGRLALWVLELPTTAPKFVFGSSDVVIDRCGIINKSIPVKQIVLGYARYGITQGPSDLSVTSQDAISDFGREYRSLPSDINSLAVPFLSVESRNTSITLSVDAATELAREFGIWAVERQTCALQLTNGLHQFNIGDTVSVTLSIEGLENGFIGIIVAYIENVPNETRIEIFGNAAWTGTRLVTDSGVGIVTDSGTTIVID